MKHRVNWIKGMAYALLLFNGSGALIGGYSLMRYPDGHMMQLDPSLLQHTPFTNYFIPGLILFMANGCLSTIIIWMLVAKKTRTGVAMIAQGMILGGWIIIQMLLIRTVFFLHIIFILLAIAFLILGYLLRPSHSS